MGSFSQRSNSVSLYGTKKKLEYRVAPEEIDYTDKANRYNFKYIPDGGVNVVSEMLKRKYDLS